MPSNGPWALYHKTRRAGRGLFPHSFSIVNHGCLDARCQCTSTKDKRHHGVDKMRPKEPHPDQGNKYALIFIIFMLSLYMGGLYRQQCNIERLPMYTISNPDVALQCRLESLGLAVFLTISILAAFHLMGKIETAKRKRWLRMRLTKPSLADTCYYICMCKSVDQMRRIRDFYVSFLEFDDEQLD